MLAWGLAKSHNKVLTLEAEEGKEDAKSPNNVKFFVGDVMICCGGRFRNEQMRCSEKRDKQCGVVGSRGVEQ